MLTFQSVCKFSENYPSLRGGLPTDDQRADQVKIDLSTLAKFIEERLREKGQSDFEMEVSEGAGAFPRFTWVCALPKGEKVSKGIYAGACFDRFGRGALVGCLTSVIRPRCRVTAIKRDAQSIKRIDVGNFNHAFMNSKEFLAAEFDENEFVDYLLESLVKAKEIIREAGNEDSSVETNFPLSVESEPVGRGFVTKQGLPGAFQRSLITKPFLILTGPSGTGKTRGAVRLAEMVCDPESRALVAVGADWTDNRHVLGYLNPLQTAEGKSNGTPIYETTAILDLILHANDHRDQPHVLILDEMNLSHVERYFADFLSAMELDDKTNALKLHAAGNARTRSGVDVPGRIDFPENLFVIGTVNIDETTYMFSPKVLDRANVIEIDADETALENFLTKIETSGTDQEGKDYGISFLEAARVVRNGDEKDDRVPQLPDDVCKEATKHLMALFRIMKRGRGEYGFRTGKEVMAYLRTAHFLAGPDVATRKAWAKVSEPNGDWVKSLDEQVLQKILPKLHGSRSRLTPLLGALTQYCATGNETYALEHFPGEDGSTAKRGLRDACATSSPVFDKSHEKLKRMISVLVEEQFVSFIC